MHKPIRSVLGIVMMLFALNSYAIQVSVSSSSNGVAALGFTVNGKNHGGAGKSYSNSDVPAGSYSFGVRVGGLLGKDVGCTVKGNGNVTLTKDASVTLNYNGKTCTAKIAS